MLFLRSVCSVCLLTVSAFGAVDLKELGSFGDKLNLTGKFDFDLPGLDLFGKDSKDKVGSKKKLCECDKGANLTCDSVDQDLTEFGSTSRIVACDALLEIPAQQPCEIFVTVFNLTGCDAILDDLTTLDLSAQVSVGGVPIEGVQITLGDGDSLMPNQIAVSPVTANGDDFENRVMPPTNITTTLNIETDKCFFTASSTHEVVQLLGQDRRRI
uniref:Uncharacterized protein n=1 Tax=Chromera velia CCMP2878 TaxID=1169474 RepID=A0A0G4I3D7_9ALVE|mmetsp:Transcript_33115/g.65732  ORF Transcript_33115/g.65732 Transcript_33115/m.65732 type:complete len:213 (-) Transcript_33115:407-1045(-)|eukprot:Cvel_10648.t1-p1 / transcript=Cvel_10648.t1 / gene=Cvel_10648 / organism=Chromera_velia_CCMP2878 / gene_product=hypothetical protein / transcript_product=hypothetical protein / location=Cvel_scaffold647:24243-24878(+) / protein_length=212 / sequence_SO=supercontig / SO=protein_coding / is_pseudo=false